MVTIVIFGHILRELLGLTDDRQATDTAVSNTSHSTCFGHGVETPYDQVPSLQGHVGTSNSLISKDALGQLHDLDSPGSQLLYLDGCPASAH